MRIGTDGRRYFGDGDTCDEGHEIGDRHESDGPLLEWTGFFWAPVCPSCDVPMNDRINGRLLCGRCGTLAGVAR